MNFLYESDNLYLKVLNDSNAAAVLNFLLHSKESFESFEPAKPSNFYTEKYQKSLLRLEFKAFLKTNFARFYVYKKDDANTIIGTISFSNILHAPYDSAFIGYKFSPDFQGKGYATEAVSLATYAMFHDGNCHRIQAYVMPDNEPSIKLLKRIGYECEGLCKEAVNINGKYCDHLLFSIINSLH